MKKVLMTLALVAVAATSAFAQISVGAGYLSNKMSYSVTSGSSTTTDYIALGGAYIGADYTLDLGQGLGIQAGLKGEYLTGNYSWLTVDTKRTEFYLAIPVQCVYSYQLGTDLKLFALAGPSLALGLSSKDKNTGGLTGTVTEDDNYADTATYSKTNLFLGVAAGVDVMNTIRIKVGYDIGLLDRHSADDKKINDAQWYVGVAYLF